MADRYSQIAAGVKPYIVSWIRDILAHVPSGGVGGAGGSVVVSGAPSPHALGSSHHEGVLLDEQGPQFLLVDGSRALTGNWSVSPGITIDGVDISAHAANADAHHNTNHVLATNSGLGSTHTMSGATAGHVLRASSATAAAFAQLQHNDLGDVTADQHHNQVHVITGGDHTVTGAALDVIGLSGTNTLAVLTPSSDVGTSPVAALLRSTSAGGLILGTLGVKGNVDITNGGDLTVGGGVGVLFVDVSLESIGVNRAPDPQFDLDVAGALRAQYLVGKHAIQLDEALLIAHFDGRGPYNTNTIGNYHGHAGQVPVVSGDVLVREGLFASSVEIAPAYSNVVTNPQFDSGSTTGWANYSTGSATGTRATTQEDGYAGAYSYRLEKTGGANTDRWGTEFSFSATSGQPYAGSVWVKVLAIDTGGFTEGEIAVALTTGAFGGGTAAVYTFADDPDLGAGELPINEWVRIVVTATASSTASGVLRVRTNNCTTVTMLVDAAQVTNTAYQHAYFNGTRTQGSLKYTGIPVNWRRLTWMAWIRLSDTASASGVENQVGEIRVDASNRYNLIIRNADNTLRLNVNGSAVATSTATIPARRWTHVALTVSGQQAQLYINGAADGSGTIPTLPVGLPDVQVGDRSSLDRTLDGHLDEFVITSKVEPARSIRAVYESNAPVFAESSVFHFKTTPKQLVWADDEGLWMRDTAGNAVAGFYGNDAGTKSWGGQTLSVGDILFGVYGASNGGWMWFDQDAVSSKPQWSWGYANQAVLQADANGARVAGTLGVTGSVNIASGALVIDPNGIAMQSGTGLVNRIKWWAPSDAGFMGAIRVTGNTLGGPADMYITAGGVGPEQQGIGQGRLGTILLGAYSDANTDAGPDLRIAYDSGIRLRATNSGSPPTLTISTSGFTFANGTFLDDLRMAANEYMHTERVRATTSGGLRLEEDGGALGIIVADGGDVGVRQSTPGYTLHVGGAAGVDGTFAVQSDAGRTLIAKTLDSGLFSHIGTESNHQLTIVTNNTEAIRITNGQLVGVGTLAAPTAQFEVLSGSASRVATIVNSASSPSADILRVLRNGAERVTVTSDGWLKLVDSHTTAGPILYLQNVAAHADNRVAGLIRAMAKSSTTDKTAVDVYFQVLESDNSDFRTSFLVVTQHANADRFPFALMGASVGLVGASLESYLGGGKGVVAINNAETAPSSNPTAGGILYAEGGAGKWRGSSGTITTFANADPHCPVCGADYMKEWDNAEYGYFAMCLKCLADELGERPWIVRGATRL